jgi:threonine/homoserine/homoserine lactone efflux protein
MDSQNLALFLWVSMLLILAPGPDSILVLTRGITMGRKAAWVSATGTGVGLVCHSLLALVVLPRVLPREVAGQTSPESTIGAGARSD